MHRLMACLSALCLATGASAVICPPAAANRGGFAHCGESDCDSGAHRDDGRGGGERSRRESSETDCWLLRVDIPVGSEVYDIGGQLLGVADGTGAWFYKVCNGSGEGALLSSNPLVFVPDPSPEALRQQALAHLGLPKPTIETSPPADKLQLVNLESWLSVAGGWETLTSTAAVPGVSVTVRAEPRRVVWEMGTGDTVVCDGPGSTYDGARPGDEQPPCAYGWPRSSAREADGAFHVTATLQWAVSWTITGAPGGGSLPGMQQSTTRAMRVGEAQARSGSDS
ncbi:MAG: hypothetical protein QOK43_1856 [Acidimicrobiaceae bacterium]|nr:hypothetical protein [Acidimicrobiaceae bacterium]